MCDVLITLMSYSYRKPNQDISFLLIILILLVIFGIGGVIIYTFYRIFKPIKPKIPPETKVDENSSSSSNDNYFKMQLNNIKRQIYECINIIQNTSNPETFFERGRFAYKRINDLHNIEVEMNEDHNESQYLYDYFTNYFDNLIKKCYDEYVRKANLELKTQSGINKRIGKFWFIAGKYLTLEEIEKIKNKVGCTLQDDDDYLINSKDWFDFEEKNRIVIEKHINKFEKPLQLASQEKNIDKKIEFLKIAIDEYENQRKWFYNSSGGKEYFKLYYENLHNSRCADFDYIDQAKENLKLYREFKTIIIPKILDLASQPEGVLQKDLYKHFGIDRSDIQYIVRYLETNEMITKTKKGNTYLIISRCNRKE